MPIDHSAAYRVMGALGNRLGIGVEESALGIIRITNERMVQAAKLISVQKGHDPSNFTLLAFGGAGGLHVCDLAQGLNMHQAMVPHYAGVLSALGMLVAGPQRTLSRTYAGLLKDMSAQGIARQFSRLSRQGMAEMSAEGVSEADLLLYYSVDLRYQGQSHYLNVPWQDKIQAENEFTAQHETRYGHRLDLAVELVNVRLCVRAPGQNLRWRETAAVPTPAATTVPLYGESVLVPVWRREQLMGREITGPALVADNHATSYIARGWRCRADSWGNLLLLRY